MSDADRLVLGDWNAACYECGRKKKATTLKKHWRGYWVCPDHWEPRHPQDFVGPVPQPSVPSFVQPQADVFIDDGIPPAVPFDPSTL